MTNQNTDPRIGLVLSNGTRIIEPLASGGMGVVYIGVDALNRKVVVKFLKYDKDRGTSTFAEFKRKFVEEAKIMVNLEDCRAFPKVYHLDEEKEALTMEYIRGRPLHEVLARSGKISSRDLRKYLMAFYVIAESLAKAHSAQIVHRDIKPDNMIEMPERRGVKDIRLIDLGISKEFKPDSDDIMISGTPDYMPPEQYTEPMTNRQADQYALGCVLFELFTGEKFITTESDNPLDALHQHTNDEYRQQRFSVITSYRKRALIELMMVKNPRERLGGMLEVMGAFKLLERQLQIEEEEQFLMKDSLTDLAALIKLGAEGAFGGQWEMQGAQKLLHRQIEARKGKPQTVTAQVPQALLGTPVVQQDPEDSIPTEQAVSEVGIPVNSVQLVSEAPAEVRPGTTNVGNFPPQMTPLPPVKTLTPIGVPPAGHPLAQKQKREPSGDELAATESMDLPELPSLSEPPYPAEDEPQLKRKGGMYLLLIAVVASLGLVVGIWYTKRGDAVSKPDQHSSMQANKPSMKPAMRPIIIQARRVPPMRPSPMAPVIVRINPRTPPKPKVHPYDALLKKCPPKLCKHVTGEEAWIRKQAQDLPDPCVALKVFLKMKEIYTVKFVKDKNGKQIWNIKYIGKKQKWGIIWNIRGHDERYNKSKRRWTKAYKGYTQRCKEFKAAQKK